MTELKGQVRLTMHSVDRAVERCDLLKDIPISHATKILQQMAEQALTDGTLFEIQRDTIVVKWNDIAFVFSKPIGVDQTCYLKTVLRAGSLNPLARAATRLGRRPKPSGRDLKRYNSKKFSRGFMGK